MTRRLGGNPKPFDLGCLLGPKLNYPSFKGTILLVMHIQKGLFVHDVGKCLCFIWTWFQIVIKLFMEARFQEAFLGGFCTVLKSDINIRMYQKTKPRLYAEDIQKIA